MTKRVAFLATDGVEQVELVRPLEDVADRAYAATLISLRPGTIRAVNGMEVGDEFEVDSTLDQVSMADFDALVIPGGVANPDRMRMDPGAVEFVRSFFLSGKPIAAICHAPWMLVEAGVVNGRTLTAYPSLRTDITNAGGRWIDAPVHAEEGIVTSRRPGDLDVFGAKLLEEIEEGVHERVIDVADVTPLDPARARRST